MKLTEDILCDDIPDTVDDVANGDIECPVHDCNMKSTMSKCLARRHFERNHRTYEIKYTLLRFIDSGYGSYIGENCLEKYPRAFIGLDEKRKSAVNNHPVFTKEMYEHHWSSIEEAVDELNKGFGYTYEYDDTYAKKQCDVLDKQRVEKMLDETHKIYGPNWGEVKWEIYLRDNGECRVTENKGLLWDSHQQKLDIHHIKPAREFIGGNSNTDYDAMNDPSNLITLTDSVHGRLEGMFTDCDPDEFVEKAREHLSIEQ